MTRVPGHRAMFAAQRGFREDWKRITQEAADQITGRLQRATVGFDDQIQERNRDELLDDIGGVVQGLFVFNRRAFGTDGVTPLAPYPEALMRWISRETLQVAEAHERVMRRFLPEDVLAALRFGGRLVAEQTRTEEIKAEAAVRRLFEPNALAEYEAAHTWIDPNGHRLSDRIWQASQRTRSQIDSILADGINNGQSALNISRRVEQFLVITRRNVTTTRPLNVRASFDALRLARTEITRAHGQATIVASRMNPYVDEIAWVLSPSHPKPDICDVRAQNGPYAVDGVPGFPAHPQDLCTLQPQVTRNPAAVTAELRENLERVRMEAFITPADAQRFTRALLGDFLASLALQAVQTTLV